VRFTHARNERALADDALTCSHWRRAAPCAAAPLVTGNIPRHKGAHGPNAAPPHTNKQRPQASHLSSMGPHKTFASRRIPQYLKVQITSSMIDQSMHMHKERSARCNPCGHVNGTHVASLSLLAHYGLMAGNKRGFRCSPCVCVKKWTASSLISVPSL